MGKGLSGELSCPCDRSCLVSGMVSVYRLSKFVFFFSDELKKKISESYSIFRSHVIEDLRPIRESEWNEIQQACRLVILF